MKRALDELPHGLNEALDSTLSRIRDQPDGRRRLGFNILMWISHAKRPLLVNELSEALAIRLGDKSLDSDNQPRPGVMVDCCMGLVTVDEKSSEVRAVHFSVQEYLYSNQIVLFPEAEEIIAGACITYLLFDVFGEGDGCRGTTSETRDLISKHPFVRYSSCYWGFHAQRANKEGVEKLALNLLRSSTHRTCSYQLKQLIRGRIWSYHDSKNAASCKPLSLAISFGLDRVVERLLDEGDAMVNDMASLESTALIVASSEGNRNITDHLLRRNADVTPQNRYGTALHCTAKAGKAACIPQLIAAGLSVDFRDRHGRTSLHCATLSGHTETMKVLLELGADVNAQYNSKKSGIGFTPLRCAVHRKNFVEVIKLLTEKGAQLKSSITPMVTPVHDAAAFDLQAALELLLGYGLDANTKAANGSTPLHFAACQDHTEVVAILLAHGADIDARTNDGATPIYLAAERRGNKTLRLLLDNGANLNVETDEQLTALDIALREGFNDIALVLVEANAERGRKHRTTNPLCGFGKDSMDLVQLLIQDVIVGPRELREVGKAGQMRLMMKRTAIPESVLFELDGIVRKKLFSYYDCDYVRCYFRNTRIDNYKRHKAHFHPRSDYHLRCDSDITTSGQTSRAPALEMGS